MSSRKRPHSKTIEGGRLQELQKPLIIHKKKTKRNQCLMSVFIHDMYRYNRTLRPIFHSKITPNLNISARMS